MLYRLLLSVSLIAACAASATAQERQWTLDASDEDAYLIFGVPETDDVGVSFWCPVQKGEVNIFVPDANPALEAGKDVVVTLKAAGVTADLYGKTEANLEAGTTSAEATAPADLPVFAAMLTTDRFRVIVGGEENIFPLIDADIEGLLALCRKP
jgi:hypothetical protein